MQQLGLAYCATAQPLVLPRASIGASTIHKGAKHAAMRKQRKLRDISIVVVVYSSAFSPPTNYERSSQIVLGVWVIGWFCIIVSFRLVRLGFSVVCVSGSVPRDPAAFQS